MGKRVYDVPDMHCEHCKKKSPRRSRLPGPDFSAAR